MYLEYYILNTLILFSNTLQTVAVQQFWYYPKGREYWSLHLLFVWYNIIHILYVWVIIRPQSQNNWTVWQAPLHMHLQSICHFQMRLIHTCNEGHWVKCCIVLSHVSQTNWTESFCLSPGSLPRIHTHLEFEHRHRAKTSTVFAGTHGDLNTAKETNEEWGMSANKGRQTEIRGSRSKSQYEKCSCRNRVKGLGIPAADISRGNVKQHAPFRQLHINLVIYKCFVVMKGKLEIVLCISILNQSLCLMCMW